MKLIHAALPIAILCSPVTGSFAQDAQRARGDELPKACQTVGQDRMGHEPDRMGHMGQGGMRHGMQRMHGMSPLSETQQALQEAMMKMQPAMMEGMMAKDADVAWICSMIPHHQGAIDMARAGLKGADNSDSKQLAEDTIKSNEREKAKLVEWVEKYAAKESRNETTGTSK